MSIVITGNPGVGKHTISEKIAEKMNLKIVDINTIAKKSGLFETNSETNDVDTNKLKDVLSFEISSKCIIVGHLAPYVLEKKQIEFVIVLRRNPYDLIEVYKKRNYSKKKILDNTGSEVLGIIAHDVFTKFGEKSFQINVSNNDIDSTVNRIKAIIQGKKQNDDVDWLELVTKNGDLENFFVD